MVEKRNPQEVRKSILEAANTCFAEMGVKKATMSKIADRAGVTIHDITSLRQQVVAYSQCQTRK